MAGRFTTTGVWLVFLCILHSQDASACPTFPVKQENKRLTFSLLPDKCELVVSVRVVMRTIRQVKSMSFVKGRALRPLVRNLHLTEVKMVPTETANHVNSSNNVTTTEAPAACPNFRIRNIGLLTVIDTIKNVCQLAVGVDRIKVDTTSPRRRDRFDFVPVFRYLEEDLF
ncbi:uncharacterized protein LOC132559860 [Ylistrum balloti]|uniref:uncharacterized protein LOC132559860 n=1 Tax=Ylistrum balloti TaxID=509963 RepID=UPI0029058F3E|nr:uncharacterized protein LOC132559860 [Ylistrum balloti]